MLGSIFNSHHNLRRVQTAHGRRQGMNSMIIGAAAGKGSQQSMQQIIQYSQIEKHSLPGISLIDITEDIRSAIGAAGLKDGVVNVLSRHTTTAVTINEAESRLMDDIRQVIYRGS